MLREKSQTQLKEALKIDRAPAGWSDFVLNAICLDLLFDLRPSVVAVVNAFAAGILKPRLVERASLNFDHGRGHHFCEILGQSTPVFFSGMLTGQRALDTHSRERLIWHVHRALKQK